jgi:hypothetical protein
MASRKEYAYYRRGHKIAIIEKDQVTGSGQTLSAPGLNDVGTHGDLLWKSPISAIEDGLEIEYTYRPEFNILSGGTLMETGDTENLNWGALDSACYFSGGNGTDDGYLTFGIPLADPQDLAADLDPDVVGTQGLVVGDKILVQGSNRWNGVHEIKDLTYKGQIITTTRFGDKSNFPLNKVKVDLATQYIKFHYTSASIAMPQFPSGTNYVWIGGPDPAHDTANQETLWKVTSDGGWKLNRVANITIQLNQGGTGDSVLDYNTLTNISPQTNDYLSIRKAYIDHAVIYTKDHFEVMEDESFELDIPDYAAKALIYYLKARFAEDAGEFELKEYFMREFKALLEKHDSSRVWGPRILSSGQFGVR